MKCLQQTARNMSIWRIFKGGGSDRLVLAVIFLTAWSGADNVAAAETNCAPLVDAAYTMVYQNRESLETVASTLESYRNRLLACSSMEADEGMTDVEITFLIASIEYLQGQVAYDRGDNEQAEEKFVSVIDDMERLIDEGIETSEVPRLLADAYIARGEYKGKLYGMRIIRDVRRLLTEAVALDPIDGRVNISLARYYLNAPTALGGDAAKALEHVEIARRSVEEVVQFEALILLSDIHRELGAVDQSDDAFSRAAQIFPSNEKVIQRRN